MLMDRSEDLPFDWWTALSLSDEVAKLPEEVSDPDLFFQHIAFLA